MTRDVPYTHSDIDERHGVPGDERLLIAHALAVEVAASGAPRFDTASWQAAAALDASRGFGTRFAARALLRRPSDGRVLLFRYPFRAGSTRLVVPGGGAEPGEGVLDAATREVVEETGTEPRGLRPSGLLVCHLLASTLRDPARTPTIQYSPVLLGEVDDHLPDTGGREACWFTADELDAQPHHPITQPLLDVLRAHDAGEAVDPRAAWLAA